MILTVALCSWVESISKPSLDIPKPEWFEQIASQRLRIPKEVYTDLAAG